MQNKIALPPSAISYIVGVYLKRAVSYPSETEKEDRMFLSDPLDINLNLFIAVAL